jgi:ribosomal protein L13E
MNINGRYMDEGDAARRLEEIRTAVSMVPFNHPLRALLDFLIGYIDALGMEVEDAGAQLGLLDEAKKTNQSYEEEVQALRNRLEQFDPALAPLLDLRL